MHIFFTVLAAIVVAGIALQALASRRWILFAALCILAIFVVLEILARTGQ